MLIWCLIERVGVTPVILPPKSEYKFMPIPGSKKGEVTTSYCDIDNQPHIDFLLGRGLYARQEGVVLQFKEYDEEEAFLWLQNKRRKVVSTEGFMVQKDPRDKGYIIVDKRMITPSEKPQKDGRPVLWFAGTEEVWFEDRSEPTPFQHEIEAYQSIKEFAVQMQEEEDNAASESPKAVVDGAWLCQECKHAFSSPMDLAIHLTTVHVTKANREDERTKEAAQTKKKAAASTHHHSIPKKLPLAQSAANKEG